METKKYTVRILDNFHFMDQSEEYNSGTFDTHKAAVDKCKRIIDEFLESAYRADETAEGLYATYIMYGETPIILGPDSGNFSSNDYTMIRCIELTKRDHQSRKS